MSIDGIYRVFAAVPPLHLGDPSSNALVMREMYLDACSAGASLVAFPELSVTGYSCGDLFEQRALLDASLDALARLCETTREGNGAILIAGVPILKGTRLFNCAAVMQNGELLGLTVKSYLPEYREFYEKRHFRPASECDGAPYLFQDREVPFEPGIIYQAKDGFRFGVEICEDLWVVEPPSNRMALNGAQLVVNISAGPELVSKAEYRKMLVTSQSARLCAAYILAGAGVYESTSDLVFSGHAVCALNGRCCSESERFSRKPQLVPMDFVPRWLDAQRRSWTSFNDVRPDWEPPCVVDVSPMPQASSPEGLSLPRHPFVPEGSPERDARCEEIFSIQASGLARRVEHTSARRLVIGISGGLDSTLALLVCDRCCEMLGRGRDFILAVTMPGMGTTSRTRDNAAAIAELIGAELREIPIARAVEGHFQDIGHDPGLQDVVYENAQARERTQILMDLANQEHGLLVGTGDLSEIALGWSTFNGDHMSMYCVNCGVPKTLIRFMVEYVARGCAPELARRLVDVNETPVSPELLPGAQHTEAIIGKYDLHDFFLYFFLKYGETPQNILELAYSAFGGLYSREEIASTLQLFYRRFFSQQFKRNAMPDGPKVGTIALSPRGDWRMPADASQEAFRV